MNISPIKNLLKIGKDRSENEISVGKWKKFQEYCLPVKNNSAMYQNFEKLFSLLKGIYLEDINIYSITNGTLTEDHKSYIEKRPKLIEKYLDKKFFNIEEKLYLNRILCFSIITEKNGLEFKFDSVIKICKILQVLLYY